MSLILIIEDEEELRASLAAGLRRAGFDTAEAIDGDTGFDTICELQPDLVLCDISMPRLRGDALLRRVRDELPHLARLPFLFLSALASRSDILAGLEQGVDDYLTKPIDFELLIATVNARLEQSGRWATHYASDLERERTDFLTTLSERTRLSFLSAAEVLHHLSDGVFLLNQNGTVIFINRVARLILSKQDGLALLDGQLIGQGPELGDNIGKQLVRTLAATPDGDPVSLTLSRPSGRPPYTMRLCRLETGLDLGDDSGPLAAVFLSDPDSGDRPSEGTLIARYHFTPTEARIVFDLTRGFSVNEISKAHTISRNTIHHHLRSIFRKTKTTRQSALVAVILSDNAPQNPASTSAVDG